MYNVGYFLIGGGISKYSVRSTSRISLFIIVGVLRGDGYIIVLVYEGLIFYVYRGGKNRWGGRGSLHA